jgi:RecJ-like exonuclease
MSDRSTPEAVPRGTPGAGENLCRKCEGSGKVGGDTCPECRGTGKVNTPLGGA